MTQQQAHLIPYKGEATLQIGYRGYITLAYRSERVQTIFPPQVVYAGDEFDYQHGTSAFLLHKPSRDADRSDDEVTDAYCMIKLRGDDEKIFHVMPRKELDKARAVSKADNDQAPWRLWFSEMCRKTVIKNIAKYAPVGDQFTEVAAIDETTPRIEDGIIDVESIVNAPPEPTRLGTAKAAMEAANGVTDDRREFEKPPAESELDPKSITAIKVLRDECFDKKLLTPAAFKKKLRAFGIGDPWEEKITGRQADMLELELSECVESGENEPEI